MKLHFNADLARERLSDGLVRQELDRAKGFYRQLAALTPESADWGVTGWLHCEEAAMQRRLIAEKAREIRQCADVFVLVGVGGSNQSARAMIEALKKSDGPEILYAGNTLSVYELSQTLQKLEGKSVYINVIAKNFETLEPGSHFRVLRGWMRRRYSKEEMARRVVLTGTCGSRLEEIAKENGCTFLSFPERIGGRYSAFSPVSLLALGVAGLDVEAFIRGGAEMEEELAREEGGIAAEYAAVRSAAYQSGFSVEMLSAFEPRLFWAQSWWKQLFGESEGKNHKGLFPASMTNSEDLHSMGQYMQEGQRILLETFLRVADPGARLVVEPDPGFGDGFDYLDGMDFADINRAAEKATIQAHAAGGVPCVQLELPVLDEASYGRMYYFFMMACALSGKLLGVNPFDQEGVEEYKRSMFAALGKPGAEGR